MLSYPNISKLKLFGETYVGIAGDNGLKTVIIILTIIDERMGKDEYARKLDALLVHHYHIRP